MKQIVFYMMVLVLSSCSVCKVAKSSPVREIHFGNGGGFTGNVTSYTLKNDGTLWQEGQQLKKISCDSLSVIFEMAEDMPRKDYVQPGNTYTFIRIITADGQHYYSWSLGPMPDKRIFELYQKLTRQL